VRLCDMSTDHHTRASALHGEPNSLWREFGLDGRLRPVRDILPALWRPGGASFTRAAPPIWVVLDMA
jgi:hypothetical protein